MQSLISQISSLFAAESINSIDISELSTDLPVNQQFSTLLDLQNIHSEAAKIAALPHSELPALKSSVPSLLTDGSILQDAIPESETLVSGEIFAENENIDAEKTLQKDLLVRPLIGQSHLLNESVQLQPLQNSNQVSQSDDIQNLNATNYSNAQIVTRSILFQVTETTVQSGQINHLRPAEYSHEKNIQAYTFASPSELPQGKIEGSFLTNISSIEVDKARPAINSGTLNERTSNQINASHSANTTTSFPNGEEILPNSSRELNVNSPIKVDTVFTAESAKNTNIIDKAVIDTRNEKYLQNTNIEQKNPSSVLHVIENVNKSNVAQPGVLSSKDLSSSSGNTSNNNIQSALEVSTKAKHDSELIQTQIPLDRNSDKVSEQLVNFSNAAKFDAAKVNVDGNDVRITDDNNQNVSIKNELTSELLSSQKPNDLTQDIKQIVSNQHSSDKTILPNNLAPTSATQINNGLAADKPTLNLSSSNEVTNSTLLAQQIVWAKQANSNHVRISITPEHLGTVDINIEHDIDGVNIQFLTQHASAKDAIETFMPRLREMLEQNGLNLQNANVSHQNEQKDGYSKFDHANDSSYGQSDSHDDDSLEDNYSNQNQFSESSDTQQYLLEAFA